LMLITGMGMSCAVGNATSGISEDGDVDRFNFHVDYLPEGEAPASTGSYNHKKNEERIKTQC
ncbi:hypothetical protein EFS38_06985, partial [Dickeya undicola]